MVFSLMSDSMFESDEEVEELLDSDFSEEENNLIDLPELIDLHDVFDDNLTNEETDS